MITAPKLPGALHHKEWRLQHSGTQRCPCGDLGDCDACLLKSRTSARTKIGSYMVLPLTPCHRLPRELRGNTKVLHYPQMLLKCLLGTSLRRPHKTWNMKGGLASAPTTLPVLRGLQKCGGSQRHHTYMVPTDVRLCQVPPMYHIKAHAVSTAGCLQKSTAIHSS